MDYEKAYKEVLNSAKKVLLDCTPDERNVVEYIFPELSESVDEEIRKALIEYYSFNEDGHSHALDNITPEQIVNWLEKQGKIDKTHYDIAEKEKREFVSDGFIKCYANFQDFKEGETYSLEYLGNDNYNVSSVNLLGKIYHITPCQLYTIFKKQTWLEKQGEQKPTDNVEPKFKIGEWISINGHVVLISNIHNDLYEAIFTNGEHRVYDTNILDKEGHLWTIGDAMPGDIIYATSKFNTFDFIYIFSEIKNENSWAYCSIDSDCDDLDSGSRYWWFDNCKGSIELERYDFYPATKEQRDILFAKMKEEGYVWDNDNKELEDLEQSPTDIAKSEFHEGDWITFYGGCPFKIVKIESELNGVLDYLLLSQNGQNSYLNKKYVDENARLWTIQDAKPGDVLVCPKYANDTIPNIFIFKDIDRKNNDVYCYCSFLKTFTTEGYVASADPIDTDFCPATKEQCDILFTKMKEEGYDWNNDNKELEDLEQSPTDNVDNANIENTGIENANIENVDIENTNNDISNDMPNLKVGDWVIREDGKPFRNGNKFAQIKSIKFDGNMCFLDTGSTGRWLYSSEIRASSIYDAQAGDVLVASDGSIFLFAGVVDCACKYYVALTTDNYVKINKEVESGFWETSRAVHPATKEQCDILFQKMEEAGYEWDSVKKEVIKINLN